MMGAEGCNWDDPPESLSHTSMPLWRRATGCVTPGPVVSVCVFLKQAFLCVTSLVAVTAPASALTPLSVFLSLSDNIVAITLVVVQ